MDSISVASDFTKRKKGGNIKDITQIKLFVVFLLFFFFLEQFWFWELLGNCTVVRITAKITYFWKQKIPMMMARETKSEEIQMKLYDVWLCQ